MSTLPFDKIQAQLSAELIDKTEFNGRLTIAEADIVTLQADVAVAQNDATSALAGVVALGDPPPLILKAIIGNQVLVAGGKTVSNGAIVVGGNIFAQKTAHGGTSAELKVDNIAAGSCEVTSASIADTSTFDLWVFGPNPE